MKEIASNYISTRDGLKLYYDLNVVDKALAMVCIFHGHGEHSGRYRHLVEYLNDHHVSCLAVDFRGHGQSSGQRGHMPSLDHVLNDMEEALKVARLNDLEAPLFIFGHSFGGCMVLNYILRKPILELSGFIASSPWLKLAFEPPRWKVKLGETMAGILPKISQPTDLDPTKLSKKQEVVDAYRTDPLVHNRMTARFFSEVTKAGQYARSHADKVELQGLVYHGTDDGIIDFDASKSFAEKSPLVRFHALEGYYHEPHNDKHEEVVFQLISDWVTQAIKSED